MSDRDLFSSYSEANMELLWELVESGDSLAGSLARGRLHDELRRDLEVHIDVEEPRYACPSNKAKGGELIEFIEHTFEQVSAPGSESGQFCFPMGLVRLLPYVDMYDYRPNAFAHSVHKHGFVGLNIGLSYAVNDACSAVAHHKNFCPSILGESRELIMCFCRDCGGHRQFEGLYYDYAWLTGPSSETVGSWVPIVVSKKPTPRSVLGEMLMSLCFWWIANHELGHILLGHLGWGSEKRIPLMEAPSRTTGGGAAADGRAYSVMHVAELEADRFATQLTLSNFSSIRENLAARMDTARSMTSYGGPWPTDLQELADFLVYSVPLIVHCVFSQISGLSVSEWSKSHPSASARRSFMDLTLKDVSEPYRNLLKRCSEKFLWDEAGGVIQTLLGIPDHESKAQRTQDVEADLIVRFTREMLSRHGDFASRLRMTASQDSGEKDV